MVVIESMSWSGSLQQRPHHLARLLSQEGVLVIYVDSDSRESKLTEEVMPNLFLIDNLRLVEYLSKSKIKQKYYWLFSTTPKNTNDLKRLVRLGYRLAYDYIDDFDEHISGDISVQLENFKIIESLDVPILVASARNLQKQLQDKFPSKHILLCQNGVDLTHFDYNRITSNSTVPIDMEAIVKQNKPIVGYYGAMAPWLDYELINDITEKRQDLNFVFLGIDYNGGLKNLRLRDNIYFLGPKDYFKLQDYSKLFDCAIIPFERGDIAKSTSPVKLFEYMAMGLPTICTGDLYECRGYEYVYVSESNQDFINNIDTAIAKRKQKSVRLKLVRQAEQNTWNARVEAIYKEMKGVKS